ncbi:glycosyltransferase family 2 protein [Alphaproteobacteria bacterium]|nr:glycosyltransferase family 2 protein [Alphaproteobacteria bacterium]
MSGYYILMPAYKASKTLQQTIEKIPKEIYSLIKEIVIVEDINNIQEQSTSDELFKKFDKCKVIFHKKNLGYGAAQKTGYKYCMEKNSDGVILLHSDGQYHPKYLNKIINFIESDKIDVVQGSRMMNKGDALRGGMPLWKYVLNKMTTFFENKIYRTNFSEFHSGYMAYSNNALRKIPFESLSNTFHFDGEMLIMTKINKLKFVSFPIDTHYGDETSSLNPISYGFQIISVVLSYIFGKYNKIKSDENRFN